MHNVQRPFNAHLLGEAVEKNGLLLTDHPEQLERHRPSGNPNHPNAGLHLPRGTGGFGETKMRLRTHDLPKIFWLLTVSPLCPGCPGNPSFPGGPCGRNITECSVIKLW